VQKLRAEFEAEVSSIEPERLVFLDESGCNTAMTRRHARSAKGERAVGSCPANWGENITILGAIRSTGVVAMATTDAPTTTDVFDFFVERFLLPNLRPGEILVMDNLSAHHSDKVRKRIEEAGHRVLFLPPYSPDKNPIENYWSKLKAFLRAQKARARDALDNAITVGLQTFQKSDFQGYFQHANYMVN
jgi:transposase